MGTDTIEKRMAFIRAWDSDEDFMWGGDGPYLHASLQEVLASWPDCQRILEPWQQRVHLELNDCGVSDPNSDSVLEITNVEMDLLDKEGKVTNDKETAVNLQATFTGWLRFEHSVSLDSQEDVIDHVFYRWGGCGGEFRILDDREAA